MVVQSQMCSSENMGFSQEYWMGDGGIGNGVYGYYANDLQEQQGKKIEEQSQIHHHQSSSNNNQMVPQYFSNDHSNLLSKGFSQSLAAQVETHEIDQLIRLQSERLRLALQEQRKQQSAILLKKLEWKMLSLLRQKDEDMAKVANRTMELENCLRNVEMENQAWQGVAREYEAMVIALNNRLEQVKENVCWFFSGAEDEESCCNREKETREMIDEEGTGGKMVCMSCNSQGLCVVFLPCMHLCSCKSCEALLDACPICKSVKKSSIEILMF